MGDLSHYLLTTWLILAIGLGFGAEMSVRALAARLGARAGAVGYTVLALAVLLAVSNWSANDQSANQDGERFTAEVFDALPQDAVLVTYWAALAPLSYKHCVEGVRPDVSLRAYDEAALVTCDAVERPLTDVAKRRPVYALMVFPESLRAQTGLDPVPDRTIRVPWGNISGLDRHNRMVAGGGPLRWLPATPCSTSGEARDSSGSPDVSRIDRIQPRSEAGPIRRPGRLPTCDSTVTEGGRAPPPPWRRGRWRSTG
jgi:hypothetical protein